MSRIEVMAAVALAAGLSLTVAEIAAVDGEAASAKSVDSSGLNSLGQREDSLRLFGDDLREAYW